MTMRRRETVSFPKPDSTKAEQLGAVMRACGGEAMEILITLFHNGALPPWCRVRAGQIIARYHAATRELGKVVEQT